MSLYTENVLQWSFIRARSKMLIVSNRPAMFARVIFGDEYYNIRILCTLDSSPLSNDEIRLCARL